MSVYMYEKLVAKKPDEKFSFGETCYWISTIFEHIPIGMALNSKVTSAILFKMLVPQNELQECPRSHENLSSRANDIWEKARKKPATGAPYLLLGAVKEGKTENGNYIFRSNSQFTKDQSNNAISILESKIDQIAEPSVLQYFKDTWNEKFSRNKDKAAYARNCLEASKLVKSLL